MSPTADLVVVGAGVVGLTAALAWVHRHPSDRVVVLDKEPEVGRHASGRNSGVLHAGFYYTADSLKARFSVDGRARLAAWCEERGLPLRRCGKLVVARDESEVPTLDELAERADRNGVRVSLISADEARAIEPRVRTVERALWSPDTASVDPGAVVRSLADAAVEAGVELRLGTAARGRHPRGVDTEGGPVPCGLLLNCAGLYADRIAAHWGVGQRYRILPFKGLYAVGTPEAGPLACHVYPVPEPGMPFLGVHFTVTPSGGVWIGPTALPALWREQYAGLGGMRPSELVEVMARQASLIALDRGFRGLALRELPKLSRARLVRRASVLLDGVDPRHYPRWGRPGIRAQLLDRETRRLVTDFVVEPGDRSVHVLNAVSPAFTSSLAFADHLVAELEAVA